MLSGIGPAEHLKETGAPTLVDLPVGDNLQDHLAAWFSWTRNGAGAFTDLMRADRIALAMARAYMFGTGPATSVPTALFAFVRTDDRAMRLISSSCSARTIPRRKSGFPACARLRQTRSASGRRCCTRRAVAPCDCAPSTRSSSPKIAFNFLTDPADMQTIIEGSRRALDVAAQKPLDGYRAPAPPKGMV
jgi:4-pyridoxate dehydrogenase